MRFIFAFLLALLVGPSFAADNMFPTPGNALAPGAVNMCWTGTVASPCGPTNPLPVTGGGGASQNAPLTETNSTISVTNTFQTALAASATRKACTIQNQGTHVMYGYASEANAPTTANSIQFQPGQQFICQGIAAIQITGTAGDAYVVTSQ